MSRYDKLQEDFDEVNSATGNSKAQVIDSVVGPIRGVIAGTPVRIYEENGHTYIRGERGDVIPGDIRKELEEKGYRT